MTTYSLMMGLKINRKITKAQFKKEYRNVRLYVQKFAALDKFVASQV